MALNPLGIGRVHDSLTSGADSNGFGQLRVTGARHPGYLRGKVLDVFFLLLQGGVGDKDREVDVLEAHLFNFSVEPGLDPLPDGEGPGAQHVAPAHVVVLDHLRLGDHLEKRSNNLHIHIVFSLSTLYSEIPFSK